ncbi:MAG: hypothetical protein KKB50_10815, partial [Planctomycetes bacterium]|nr:hypothetical protein [Planctomycetota bacterium]
GEWFAFDGMPWEDVVRHMARRIGKPLMYEDQIVIGGELTYHNERIFTKDEALDELNLLLHELGYRFIETEHHIYVVPLAEVPQYIEIDHVYETVEKFQQAKLRDMDFAIVYVEVKDYPAQQVLEMFNTSLPDYALLSVVGQTNKLKVQALVRDINKLLVLMDRVSMKKVDPRETRFITVKTNVRDIERFVREQFDVGSVRPTFDPQTKKFVSSGGAGGDIRITADDRANTLIVKATPTELDEIEEFVEKIDSKPDLGFITKVIEIQHANATEVATLLNEVFRQEQAQQPSWQRLRTPTPTPNRSSSRSRTPPRTTPQSTAPQDILGEGAIERAKKTIRIVAFDRTNSIAVYANQEGHERVEEMLQKIDVAMPKNFRTFKMENADAAEVYGTISQIAQNMEAFGVGGTTRRPTVVLDEANSALHVMADRAAMQSIEEVIKELDVTAPAGDRHVVELQNLAPSEVARVIEPLLNEGRGTPAIGPRIGRRGGRGIVRSGPSVSGKSQIIPLDDAGILIVICPPADWAKVEETIQLWDSRAISDTPEIRSFVVQHGDPSAIADTLGNFYRTYEHPALGRSQVLIAVEADKLYVQAIKPALEEIEELLKSLDVEDAQQLVILPLAHADATQVAQYLQSVFGGGGAVGGRIRRGAGMGGGGGRVSIQPEVVTNSLIVQADKKTLEDIKDFAQQMDEQVAAQTPERKFYSLTNASSRDVINAINSLFGRAGRGGRGQSAGQQVNAVVVGNQVVVEAPAEKQREIEALVTQLDTLSDQGITTLLVKMPGADVRSIAGKLSSAFQDRVRQQGITARFEADTTTETILMTCSKDAQEEAEILLKQYEELTKEHIWQTEFRQLKHASADEASNWLREQLVAMVTQQIGSTVARQIKVTADNRTNRVFMNAPQIAVKQGLLLLEQFDQPSEDIAPPPVEVWTVKLAGLDVRDLANNLQRVLNNMPPRPDRLRAVVTADQLTSNIIVSAPKDMKTQIDALIAQFSAETADMTPVQKFIEIKEADANYIADQMRRILGQQIERQRGRGAAQQMSLEVDARTNRLILNAPKFAVEMAEALIAELDKQPITGQLQTIALLNADANTVYGIIRTIFSEKIRNRTLQVSVEPLTNSLIVGGSQKDIDEIQKWSADLDEKSDAAAREQKIVDLQNANPWEVSGILQQVFVQRRRVPPSKEVNINILAGRSLVITAPPDVMKDIEAMVAELDGVTANKTVVKTIKVPGLGTQLPALARSVQDTINQQMQAREQRISIAALPAVDTLVVTALERQLPDVEAALEQFKTLFEPPKMVTFELKAGDANTVYQALNRVLQQQIRAGKIQMSVEGMTNALIVMAAEEEMADIAEWIAKFDEAAAAAIVTPRIFELKNANPWEVSGILQATFVPTGVGSRRGGVDIRFDILGGRSIVAKAPAEKMKQIEQLINELDTVVGNKARVATYVVPGMGARLTQFARDIQNAVNSQVQARDQRISVVANPAADVLVVTALEDQFELIQQAMDQFKDLYKPMKIETVALQHADANMVYQALNRVLQNKIRADKIQLSVESMTNSLIVVAAEAELEEIREWAASFDEKARESVTEPKIVELKNASPWEVVGVLNTTFVQRGQRARGGGKEISFQVMGGCSIVMHAPADQYAEIEALITQLDEIGSNKAAIRTYDVPGMGSKLTQFAREIESAVNTQVQQRDRRISVVANPTADVLIVTALEEQYELINDAMEQFKGLYKPTRIETIALQHGDANNVYQSLNTVLQNEIRAGKVQIGVEGMTNSLVVMGTDEGIAQIKEWTAKYEEKAQASITKPRIFELKNANPWEVQSILQTTFTPPGGARRQGGMEIRFDIIGGRSLVVKAPAEKLDEIAALIADLDEVGGNKTAVRTYELTGMGNKLNDLARQVREAVNVGMQAREQRISVTAYPPADALIVTATQDQFERVEQMMDEFKPLMEVSKFATEFFKLQYVDAGQIVGPVQNLVQTSIRTKGMSSRGAQDFTVTADVRTNRLIVFAPESIMPEVRTTVKELDIDMPDDNVVTIALNYADPWETQRTLTDIFRPRRGGDAAAQEVYITVSNNTLVVKAPKKKMEQIQELIARIDAEDTDGLQIKTYELKVLNASMVAGQVQAYLRSLGTVNRRGQMQPGAFAEPTTNTLVVIASERHLPFIEGMIMKLEATTRAASEPREYVLQNARADLVSRSVEAMLKAKVMEREGNSRQQSIQVSVFPDQVSNRLFVYAPEEYQELAAELIKMVDKDVDTGEIVHIVQLEQADAVELAQTINQIIQSGGVGGYGRGRSGAAGGSARQVVVTADAGSNSILLSGLPKDVAEIEGFIDELETNSEQVPELQIFQLQYATTMEVADALQSIFPSGGGRGGRGGASKDAVTITEDDYNNRLLVTANKRKMRQVEAFVKQLDAQPDEDEYLSGMYQGRELHFVDVYRGDATDIAWDVSGMLPPQDKGGPIVETDWFGEYIKVWCRPGEFPKIEKLIRDFEGRARVERTVSIRKLTDPDQTLALLADREGENIEIKQPGEKHRIESLIEDLWAEDEEPPAHQRQRAKTTPVNRTEKDVQPCPLPFALLAELAQEVETAVAGQDPQQPPARQDPPAEANQDSPAKVSSPPTAQDAQDERERGAEADDAPRQRERVQITMQPDGSVIIYGPQSQVDDINAAIDLLEEDITIGEVIRIFRFRYGDVNAAAEILDRMFNERQIVRIQQQQQQQPQPQQRGDQGGRGREQQQGGLMEQFRSMAGGRGTQATGRNGRAASGQRVRIATDPGHNYLIVKCDESDLPEIRQLLRELDIRPGQVDIKVFQLRHLDAVETAANIKDALGIARAQRGRENPFSSVPRGGGGNQQQQLMQMLQQQTVSIQGVEGGAKVESVEIVPNRATNSLMVSAPPEVMEIIAGTIDKLEKLEGYDVVVIRHYDLKVARMDDILPLLQEIFDATGGGGGRRAARGGTSPAQMGPVTISGDPRSNTLIYTCEAKDVEIVEAQIAALDVQGSINEAETYVCRFGDAAAIADVVTAIYGAGSGGGRAARGSGAPGGSEVRIVAEAVTNTIVVWGPPDKRDLIFAKIEELDKLNEQDVYEIPVVHADPEELADTLMQMFSGRGASVGSSPRRGQRGRGGSAGNAASGTGRIVIVGNDAASKILVRAPEHVYKEILELVQILDQPSQDLLIKRFDLKHAYAEVVVENVKSALAEYIQIQRQLGQGEQTNFDAFTALADPRTNSVIIVGSQETFLFVEQVLAAVDVETPDDQKRSFRIFVLEKADAETVADAINSLSAASGVGGTRGSGGGRRGASGRIGGSSSGGGGGELNVQAAAEEATNAVMVYGLPEDIAIVETSIIEPFEKISEEGKPFFVKLKYARASVVADTLEQFFRGGQSGMRGGGFTGRSGRTGGMRLSDQVSFAADPDTNTLIILASGTNREFIDTLIAELDQEEGGRQIEIFQLQFADANSTAEVVTTTFEEARRGGVGRGGASSGDADRVVATPDIPSNTLIVRANPANMEKVRSLIEELEQTIATRWDPVEIKISNAPASQVASFIWQFLGESAGEGTTGGRGSRGRGGAQGVRQGPQIIPNDSAQTLIVRGSQAEVERIRVLAGRFDNPDIVASRVKIIEVPLGQDAGSLASEIERIVNDSEQLDADRTGRQARLVVVGSDAYTNSLIVAGDPATFGTVDAVVAQLASIRPGGSVTRIIQFTNLSAEDAVEMIGDLQQQRPGSSSTSGTRRRTSTPTRSNTGTRRRGSWLWTPTPRELLPDSPGVAGVTPFVGASVLRFGLAPLILTQVADEQRLNAVIAEIRGSGRHVPTSMGTVRGQPASLLLAHLNQFEGGRQQQASRRQPTSVPRLRAKSQPASILFARLDQELPQEPRQSRPKQKKDTARRAAPGRDRIPQAQGEPAALRRAQEQERAERPKRAEPQTQPAPSQVAAQQVLGKKGLPSVSGA